MLVLLMILIIIASILLVLIVMVQNPKGGGLASNFSSQNQIMGVRKTADFLEKATWTLAISIVVFSLLAAFAVPNVENGNEEQDASKQTTEQQDQTPVEKAPEQK